jgi:hypothetical protein
MRKFVRDSALIGMLSSVALGGCSRVSESFEVPESVTKYGRFPKKFVDYQDDEAFENLKENQKYKIDYLLDELKNNENFLRSIGGEIEADVADTSAEHGGYITQMGEGLHLFSIKSALLKQEEIVNDIPNVTMVILNPNANYKYEMPPSRWTWPHIFQFHMHAITDDDSNFAGPSCMEDQSYRHGVRGDIGYVMRRARELGSSDQLVITKLEGQKINVGYYGAYLNPSDDPETAKPIVSVINLGDWEY